jgi:hypothetical protein
VVITIIVGAVRCWCSVDGTLMPKKTFLAPVSGSDMYLETCIVRKKLCTARMWARNVSWLVALRHGHIEKLSDVSF